MSGKAMNPEEGVTDSKAVFKTVEMKSKSSPNIPVLYVIL